MCCKWGRLARETSIKVSPYGILFQCCTNFCICSPFPSTIVKIIQLFPLFDFRNNNFFYCVGLLAPRQTPNLEDQGIPFCLGHHPWPVWHGLYATASIALGIILSHKPHHYVKVGVPSGGTLYMYIYIHTYTYTVYTVICIYIYTISYTVYTVSKTGFY
jgi:hypothetical protein